MEIMECFIANRSFVRSYFCIPLQAIIDDRQALADARAQARRAKADRKPLDVVYMSADAENQTAHSLPSLYLPGLKIESSETARSHKTLHHDDMCR